MDCQDANKLAPATMADIARRTGVSRVTVSAVLSASAGNNTRVAEATRQRILEAASELNYAPNGIAKMFRRSRTNIIGFYLGDWLLNTHDQFLAEIVSGLQIGCRKHRKDLLIHGTFPEQSVSDVYSELTNRKIDGLVLFARENDPLPALLASSSLPVVAVTDALSGLPSVVADDRRGSQMVADYLAAQGHKHILYRRGLPFQASANRRYESFQEAAVRHGLVANEDSTRAENYEFALSAGERAFLTQSKNERPTAIVCGNDLLAYSAFDYCENAHFRVPEDFAIIGFDGIMPQVRPAAVLTTVRAPWSEVAVTAVDLLIQRLEGKSIALETVLPVELVIGRTA